MKIQLACDCHTVEEALRLLNLVHDEIDIIEAGTDLMYAEGIKALRILKSAYPDKPLLADLKVMDGGRELAELVFENGADVMTVLAVAPEETIIAACKEAKRRNKKIYVDMMCVTDQLEKAKKIMSWGADCLCVHTADDQKENVTFYHKMADFSKYIGSQYCSIAGGMNPENIRSIKQYNPEIIVVGGYITGAKDPQKAVKEIREAING